MFYRTLAISSLSLCFFYAPAILAEDKNLTTKDIHTVVADFIKENPALIREALTDLAKADSDAAHQVQSVAAQKMKVAFTDGQDGIMLGNPKASQMIVLFSDPNCGHCKDHYKTLKEVVSKNDDVKVLIKEIPLFGAVSEQAIRATFAAHKQDKGMAFYEALALQKPGLEIHDLEDLAENLNLDEEKFSKDMETADAFAFIEKNRELAEQLSIRGTPVSVVYSKVIGKSPAVVQGAIPLDVMEGLIQGKSLDALMK